MFEQITFVSISKCVALGLLSHTTCQLHELYTNHVIKGHAVLMLLTNCTMPASPASWEAQFVNQSLGCFCFTNVNVAKDMTETGNNVAAFLKLQGMQMKIIFETSF